MIKPPKKFVGFGVRRTTCTREQMELLSEWKKLNGGKISAAFKMAISDERFVGMHMEDLIDFAENCDERLADWDKPNDQFVVIGNPSP